MASSAAARPQLLVLYGSAHGNAQGVAERLFAEAPSQLTAFDCSAQPIPMNAFRKLVPPIEERRIFAVFVTSTTGQGEFPENAGRFYRFLKRKAKGAAFSGNSTFLARSCRL